MKKQQSKSEFFAVFCKSRTNVASGDGRRDVNNKPGIIFEAMQKQL